MSAPSPKLRLCYKCWKGEAPEQGLFLLVCRKCLNLWHPSCHAPPVNSRAVRRIIDQALVSTKLDVNRNIAMDWQCHKCREMEIVVLEDSDEDTKPQPKPTSMKKSVALNPPSKAPEPIVLDLDSDNDTRKAPSSSKIGSLPESTSSKASSASGEMRTRATLPVLDLASLQQQKMRDSGTNNSFSRVQHQQVSLNRRVERPPPRPTSSLDSTLMMKTLGLSIQSPQEGSSTFRPTRPTRVKKISSRSLATQDTALSMDVDHENRPVGLEDLAQPPWLERALKRRDTHPGMSPVSDWCDKWNRIQERRKILDASSTPGERGVLFNLVKS